MMNKTNLTLWNVKGDSSDQKGLTLYSNPDSHSSLKQSIAYENGMLFFTIYLKVK